MAIVKHIKSRNANYSAAINYLLFEHDEKTGKKIVDESGRSILRKEFYMDGLNCDPMSFGKKCELEVGVCFINFFRSPQVRSWNSYFFQVHLWLLHNMIY